MHKTNFDFRILFNDFKDLIELNPTLEKTITKYIFIEKSDEQIINESQVIIHQAQKTLLDTKMNMASSYFRGIYGSNTINKSWVNFEIILENSGSAVIEDWYFKMKFISGVKFLDDDSSGLLMGDISLINLNKDDPRYIDKKAKSISYTPKGKSVLVQKENNYFKASILVELDSSEVKFEWDLIARDFSKSGITTLQVVPTYILVTESEDAQTKEEEKEEITVDYYRVKKK